MEKKISMPSHDDSRILKFGLALLIVVFGILGGWSAFANLAASSVAVGKVSADYDKKTVQHLEGGIIEALYVKDGDSVKAGDTLLKLQNFQATAQIEILTSQYEDALGLLGRLIAQNEGREKIAFSPELTNQAIIKNQENIFYTTKKLQEDEKIITKNRISQLQNQESGLNAIIESKKNRVLSLTEELKEQKELFEQKLVDKIKIREIEREKGMLDGDIANETFEISKIQQQKIELETQQFLREKEFRKETLNLLVETKAKLIDIKSKLLPVKDTASRVTVKAPIDGVIVGLDVHTLGGVIAPGKPILEIVPQETKLIVVAQVQTTDIDKLKLGLLADIRFSAFNLNQAHVVEGKVIHISADSFVDEASGMPYYEVKVEVTPSGEKQLKKYGFNLVAGMPAEVMINIGERTPLSYFLKPFTDMIARAFNEE